MQGRVREVVIYLVSWRSVGGLGAVGVESRPLLLTRPMTYTTACNTLQAVIINFFRFFEICLVEFWYLFTCVCQPRFESGEGRCRPRSTVLRTCCSTIGDAGSSFRSSQGYVLGPLLYILYTADLAHVVARHGLSLHQYADDCQVYMSVPVNGAQAAVHQLSTCQVDVEASSSPFESGENTGHVAWLSTSAIQTWHSPRTHPIIIYYENRAQGTAD